MVHSSLVAPELRQASSFGFTIEGPNVTRRHNCGHWSWYTFRQCLRIESLRKFHPTTESSNRMTVQQEFACVLIYYSVVGC